MSRLIRFMYPHIEWELRPYPNREAYDCEEDFDREFRATMILNDTTMAMWPPLWRFELDFAWKIAFPILVVASLGIPFVIMFLFGGG